MKSYVGVKMVKAEPCEKDGAPGYTVVYPDGYDSWSPAAVFEAAYLPIEREHNLSKMDVACLIESGEVSRTITTSRNGLFVSVEARLPFGWIESRGVTPETSLPLSEGAQRREVALCEEKVFDALFEHLNFTYHWAKYGLTAPLLKNSFGTDKSVD